MEEHDEYFDVEGVSRYLKVSSHTIRQYVHKGKIPYIKVPGGSNLVRFPKSQIDEWMMQGFHGAEIVAEKKEEYLGGGDGKAEKKER